MADMRCPSCATESRSGVKFCEECGTRLEAACASCGASVPAGTKFCGACGAAVAAPAAEKPAAVRYAEPQSYTPAHLAQRILKDRAALSGERKLVTVLFADVSGFTSLSEHLDPEEVHGVIKHAFDLMLAEIHRYEGTVNQFLGDGLMALFGAPIAHEDHAVRAAHAALALQRALAAYREELLRSRGIDFRMRLGLNTGLVVVGAIGDNLRMDYTAVGDTTNIAARMQQLAEPGTIAVAETTAHQIEPYFELRQLGTFTVKNRARPVNARQLMAARAQVSRLDARTAHGLSPFVGRDDVLSTLQRAWSAAQRGRGQAVFVVGDAGIGKSRLLHEFRERVAHDATWIQADCVSFGHSIPFLPIVSMVKRTFRIDEADGESEIAAKIERGVTFLGEEARSIGAALCYLLSVDPGDGGLRAMDPAARRKAIVAAIVRLTAARSRQRPMVVVVEDAHWIDAASEDVLKALADALPGMTVLLVLTYRPLYQQPFDERTYYWRVALRPMDDDDAVRIVRSTLGVDDLPRDVAAAIAAKADGNPFFLEEIGRALVQTGALRVENGRLATAAAGTALAVPDTVQDVIAARIDRLAEPQKRTVQTASVIGREFALALLRRVSDVQDQLETCLSDLKRIELIYEKVALGDSEYVFRHALTQDVAYASLLQSERRRLHAQIGAALEDAYAGRLDEHAEELVHHFSRGEVWPKVARYAREAGDRASALFVDARAIELYDSALAALAHVPETAETARLGVDVRLAMRPPLWRAGQLDRIHELFREAEQLAARHAMPHVLDTVYAYMVQYHWAKGNQDQAIAYADRCLETAAARDDLALRVTGLFYRAHAYYTTGQHRKCVADCEAIFAAVKGREHERLGLSGLPYSGAAQMAGWALAELGDLDGALAILDRGEAIAEAASNVYSLAVVRGGRTLVLALAGKLDEAVALGEQVVALCREKNFAGQFMLASCALAHAYAALGRGHEAVTLAQQAIARQAAVDAWSDRAWMYYHEALGHLAAGELDDADAAVARAFEIADRHGEQGARAWAHYVGALIAQRRGDVAGARSHLEQAQRLGERLELAVLLERCRTAQR
jgi:class 3 adenylate cyclase/tetratricopeptide (TPR) repeat protein